MVPAKNLRRQISIPSCPEWTALFGGSNTDENCQDWNGRGISEPSGLFYPFPRATGTPGGSYNPLTTIQQPNYTSPPPGNQLGVPKLEHPEPLVSAR